MPNLTQSDALENFIVAFVRQDIKLQKYLLKNITTHFNSEEVSVLWGAAARYTVEPIWNEMLKVFAPPPKNMLVNLNASSLLFKVWANRHNISFLPTKNGRTIIQECLISNNEKIIPEYLNFFPWDTEKINSVGVLVYSFAHLDHFDWIELLWTHAPKKITSAIKMGWLKKIESGFQDWEIPADGLEAPHEDSRWGRFSHFKEKMLISDGCIATLDGKTYLRL